MPSGLSEALREGTRALHTQLEHTGFMQALLRGRVQRAGYCCLLRNLHVVYLALEAALLRQSAHPWIAPLPIADLARAGTLEQDLDALHGADWRRAIAPVPAAQSYARHLAAIEGEAPGCLLAHVYVRYLGDLNGGQVLRRIVRSSLGLADEAGTCFYGFGTAEQAGGLARGLRSALDGIALQAGQRELLVREAQRGFALHAPLFEQLQALGPGSANARAS